MKSRKSAQKLAEKKALIYVLIPGALIAAVLVIYLFARPPEVDQFNCPIDPAKMSPRVTTLVIDTSDKLSAIKNSDALALAVGLSRTLQRYERFSVFFIKSNTTRDLSPVYSSCSPGQSSVLDHFSKGSIEIDRFVNDFTKKLTSSIETEMANQVPSNATPIIESLLAIKNSRYWGKENRVYLVSDLLEHSQIANLYDSSIKFETVDKSSQGNILAMLSLQKAKINVCLALHPAAEVQPVVQENARRFWIELFSKAGVKCIAWSCEAMIDECKPEFSTRSR